MIATRKCHNAEIAIRSTKTILAMTMKTSMMHPSGVGNLFPAADTREKVEDGIWKVEAGMGTKGLGSKA